MFRREELAVLSTMFVLVDIGWVADGQGGEDLNKVIQTAMSAFVVSNPLHPDVFPGVRKMEAEVVRMCLDL
jgi:glutamate/tyrosine decarboxylase-like PLP-dependent enzyme